MPTRRLIVGAIGGDRQRDPALQFGEAVARAGLILLTGGGTQNDDEVKNATIEGAKSVSKDAVPRYVGILDSTKERWEPFPTGFLLHTGLMHYERNVINGITPDIIVVFGGSRGTLAEAAFAASANKPLIFFGGSQGRAVERLKGNLDRYFGRTPSNNSDFYQYFRLPLIKFSGMLPRSFSAEAIFARLVEMLDHAQDWIGTADALVAKCAARAPCGQLDKSTGFIGLPLIANSKERFEEEIVRISRPLEGC